MDGPFAGADGPATAIEANRGTDREATVDMTSPSRHHPLQALFQPPALVTVVLAGEALALLLSLSPGFDGDRLVHFGLASMGIQWIALLTLGALYAFRKPLARVPPAKLAWICLALLLASTLLVSIAAWRVRGMTQPMDQGGAAFVLRMLTMALVVGLLGLLAYQNYWRARQSVLRAKQAELDALHARIRPHFLFNALNTGIALVHARPEATERLLLDLADLFRAAISGRETVTLSEEISLAQRYLEIESLRFGDRLRIRWDVPEAPGGLPAIEIPPLSIQPLVENAIKHGIEPGMVAGLVTISVRPDPETITIEVRNSLPLENGMPSAGHGIGLKAVRSRIQAFTSGLGDLQTRIVDGEHVATLTLPRQE